MKLKQGLNIEEYPNHYKFEFNGFKKITSTKLPELLGQNKFNGIGQAILERARFLDFEGIDPFYTHRGAIAESLAQDYLHYYYKQKHNIDVDLRTFDPKRYNLYDFYNKQDNPALANDLFGGVPDMVISKPSEFRSTVEVKSKNISAYDFIVNKQMFPEEEVLQGKHLTTLNRMNKLTMVWVFFTDEQEDRIRKLMNDERTTAITKETASLSIFNVKIRLKHFDVNPNEFIIEMMKAHMVINEAKETNLIPKHYFNDKEIKILNDYIEETKTKVDEPILDLDEI